MPPSHKKPITYGRRGRTTELTPTFEALSQRTPKKTLSRSNLPSPSASPLRSPFPTLRKDKTSAATDDVFDVPSSDEDSSHLKPPFAIRHTRPTSKQSTPDRSNARRKNHSVPPKSNKASLSNTQAPNASAHRELFNLSLPTAQRADLLLSDRPVKRQKTSNRVQSAHLVAGYSSTSSRTSVSAQSDDLQEPTTVEKQTLSATDDIWEVPSSESDSYTLTNNLFSSNPSQTLEFRSKTNPSLRKSKMPPTQAFKDVTGHGAPKDVDLKSQTPPRRTPELSSSLVFSPSSRGLNDQSPTPVNKKPIETPQKGTSTPKQAKLWGKLLVDPLHPETPSKRLKLLSLDQDDKFRNLEGNRQTRRKGLVDALKPSAQDVSLEDELLSEHSVVSQADDEEIDETTTSAQADLLGIDSMPPAELLDFNEPEFQPEHDKRTVISGQKRTYGGQRTYLEDSGDPLQNLLDEPLEMDETPTLQGLDLGLTSSLLQANEKKQSKAIDDDDAEDDTRGVKTVYDLRAAGGMEHFTDEVNEIFDDLNADKGALSRKRMALLDLHKKLQDSTFRTRFNQHGYGPMVLQKISAETDSIIGSIAAAVLVNLLGGSEELGSSSQLHDAGCLAFLASQLSESRELPSIVKDRRSNMSRAAQGSVDSFLATLRQSSPWREKELTEISPMSLALVALEVLVRRLREQGNSDPLLDGPMLSSLLNILDSRKSRMDVVVQDDEEPSGLNELRTILSFLESCTTVSACTLDKSTWTEKKVRNLCRHLESAMLIEESSIQKLTPRLTLNLANGNEAHSRIFSERSFVNHILSRILAEFESLKIANNESPDLDVLLLCLGAMLNLAEHSREVRSKVAADGYKQLDDLVTVFLRGRKLAEEADSLAAVQANIAYGWLAVLLGNLCQSDEIRSHISERLPGKTLKSIIDAVDEFISHHKAADQTAHGNEAYVKFTQRLEGVADLLRGLDR